jgi:hypothetical protein
MDRLFTLRQGVLVDKSSCLSFNLRQGRHFSDSAKIVLKNPMNEKLFYNFRGFGPARHEFYGEPPMITSVLEPYQIDTYSLNLKVSESLYPDHYEQLLPSPKFLWPTYKISFAPCILIFASDKLVAIDEINIDVLVCAREWTSPFSINYKFCKL